MMIPEAYYYRNSLPVSDVVSSLFAGNHALTIRQTYTVPALRFAHLGGVCLGLQIDAGPVAGIAGVYVNVDGVIRAILELDTIAAIGTHRELAVDLDLFVSPGAVVTIETANTATATVLYTASWAGTEYDAA